MSEIEQQQRRTAKTLYQAGFSYDSLCENCGKRKHHTQAEFADCLVNGFPKCCEVTMTLREAKKSA